MTKRIIKVIIRHMESNIFDTLECMVIGHACFSMKTSECFTDKPWCVNLRVLSIIQNYLREIFKVIHQYFTTLEYQIILEQSLKATMDSAN